MNRLYSTGQVAHLLNVRQHRIDYAISSNYLPDAKFRFLGKRCFDENDVRRIATYFGDSGTTGAKVFRYESMTQSRLTNYSAQHRIKSASGW